MTVRHALTRLAATVLALGLLACTGCAGTAPDPESTASVEEPRVLSDDQAQSLAAMPFRNYEAGITAFEGQLFGGESGDLALAGWIDFTLHSGYVKASPVAAPSILITWNDEIISFLDLAEAGGGPFPPEIAPDGEWQVVSFDAEASELTRMLAALLLLSADRPDNPLLVKQNGARFLGTEDVAGTPADRYSGIVTDEALAAEGAADLGTQYWLDSDDNLVRFGLRVAGNSVSLITFDRTATTPDSLPLAEGS